jgi:transcriptional regulator with XRE-family HTH domain
MDAGQIVRNARQTRNMTLAELGAQCGYSAAQVSRLERGLARFTDVNVLRAFAKALGIPPEALGLAHVAGQYATPVWADAGFFASAGHSVGADDRGEEDPMRRRSLLTVAGLAAPAALLTAVSNALAVMPDSRLEVSPAVVAEMLARAHEQFDAGQLTKVLRGIPALLATGHGITDRMPGKEQHLALLADCYALASTALDKAGGAEAARITADRAMTYAALSGDPAARATAARPLAFVLRHDGRQGLAAEVTDAAACRLADGGLRSAREANALALVLCTSAYSTAQAGDRDRAIDLIAEADRAARRVPASLPNAYLYPVTSAQVALYRLGVHWSLGETGAALRAARSLHPTQFPTPERRARLYTDLARVWDQAGQEGQAIGALLNAYSHAASEVRDRSSIRMLALGLARENPRAAGADRLARVLSSERR